MIHPERDADLLLLVHGALPVPRAALTRLHLAWCLDCRRRLQALQAASQALAGAVRGPRMPRWSPPRTAFPPLVLTAGLVVLALILVIGVGALVARGPHPAAPRLSGPCRPDLPSDRCR